MLRVGAVRVGNAAAVFVPKPSADATEIWLLEARRDEFRFITEIQGVYPIALIDLGNGECVLCGIDSLTPIRVGSPRRVGQPVEADDANWSGPVMVGRELEVLVSARQRLRLWAVEDVLAESAALTGQTLRSGEAEYFVTQAAAGDDAIYASTLDRAVHIWSGKTASVLRVPGGGTSEIRGLAVAQAAGRTCIVVGLGDGELSVIDVSSGEQLWTLQAGSRVEALTTLPLAGRPVILAAVQLDQGRPIWVCRLWELASGREIETRELDEYGVYEKEHGLLEEGDEWRLAVEGYRRGKQLRCVAVCETPGGPLAAAGGQAGVIPVWSLTDHSRVAELDANFEEIEALSFGHGHLFAGNGDGDLHGWRVTTLYAAQRNRKRLHEELASIDLPPDKWLNQLDITEYELAASLQIPGAHVGRVRAVACGTWAREPCVVSGGADGRLRSWRLDRSDIATVDVGEPITALAALEDRWFAVGTSHGLVMIETD
jgi:WD40 repeat protein